MDTSRKNKMVRQNAQPLKYQASTTTLVPPELQSAQVTFAHKRWPEIKSSRVCRFAAFRCMVMPKADDAWKASSLGKVFYLIKLLLELFQVSHQILLLLFHSLQEGETCFCKITRGNLTKIVTLQCCILNDY